MSDWTLKDEARFVTKQWEREKKNKWRKLKKQAGEAIDAALYLKKACIELQTLSACDVVNKIRLETYIEAAIHLLWTAKTILEYLEEKAEKKEMD